MRITFFVKTEKSKLNIIKFYSQDICFLEDLGYAVKIATKWREIDWKSDLIFIWWWTYASLPIVIAKWLGIKTIITGTFNFRCENFDLEYFQRNWIQRQLIYYAVKNADANILVSRNEINAMKQEWGLRNLYYSPHTVDLDKYYPSQKIQERDDYLFTLCGTTERILKRKCIPELLSAVKILKQNIPNIKLIIAGRESSGKAYLYEKIKSMQLEGNVEYIGEISEKRKIELLQNCAIYMQPSIYEGFGLATAEAMSCGAPVISTAVGAVPEVVDGAGVLLDSCNPKTIASSVIDLICDLGKRQRFGHAARSQIEKNFYPQRRKKDLNQIIDIVVNA